MSADVSMRVESILELGFENLDTERENFLRFHLTKNRSVPKELKKRIRKHLKAFRRWKRKLVVQE